MYTRMCFEHPPILLGLVANDIFLGPLTVPEAPCLLRDLRLQISNLMLLRKSSHNLSIFLNWNVMTEIKYLMVY